MDFLFNEDSAYCILPESFKDYHIGLLEDNEPSQEEIQNAEKILQRVKSNQLHSMAVTASSDLHNDITDTKIALSTNEIPDNGFMPIKW